jgi:hypothetical protein
VGGLQSGFGRRARSAAMDCHEYCPDHSGRNDQHEKMPDRAFGGLGCHRRPPTVAPEKTLFLIRGAPVWHMRSKPIAADDGFRCRTCATWSLVTT